ncbi:hypothetical protein [Streptomyces sp. WELS2]|nr:hypothetical protein [Streptomyces sp. WELS2]
MTKTQVGAAGRLLREMVGAGRDTEGTGPRSSRPAAPTCVFVTR